MREIKFRAWYRGKMYNDIVLQSMEEGYLRIELIQENLKKSSIHTDATRVKLMQYTGLLDNNGKEIYESDLLKVKIPNYIHDYIEAEVKFKNGCFGIEVIGNPILNNAVGQFKSFNENTKDIEVIGNIYENENLKN